MSAKPSAYCHVATYPATPPQQFCMAEHYLLYATQGTMALEAEGRRWRLLPARAALIAAGRPVTIALTAPLSACSALFAAGAVPAPAAGLAVFDASPLLRALLAACAGWTGDTPDRPPRAAALFAALQAEAWDLATRPAPVGMPVASSPQIARALALTETRLGVPPGFDEIARAVGLSERTLSRRFSSELGMTWRQALRRLRILRAMDLLVAPDANVARIAFDSGYRSLSAFNAAFRDITGQSPAGFRARCAAAPLR